MTAAQHHIPSPARRIRCLFMALLTLALLTATAALARAPTDKERGLLDFIGALESSGYDDYYRDVAESPPRRLTTMTVGEVLDWQDSIDARSRSEAAGRYQIMEDTLRGLVDEGVVSENTLFNAATQDALALHLLQRRGWDPARTDLTRLGDAIAHEWAALPVCSGLRAGRSAYDGLAGNTARTTCEAWQRVLANPDDPLAVADAIALSRLITASRAGQIISPLEDFLEDLRGSFFDLTSALLPLATRLFFSLLLVEWVWTTALLVSRGAGTATYISTLARRIALAGVFLFLIGLGDYGDLVIRSAEALLNISMDGASINVVDLYDRLMVTVFELFGRSWFSPGDKLAAFVILITGSMLLGLIVTAYIEVYVAFAAALVALGFAGWSGTRDIATRYLKYAAAKVVSLLVALICGVLISQLATFELIEERGSAIQLAGMLAILGLIMLTAPAAIEKAMTGRARASTGARLAGLIGGVAIANAVRVAAPAWPGLRKGKT